MSFEPDAGARHLNGCCWTCAPRPLAWHRCWAQTIGQVRFGQPTMFCFAIEICPCGGSRIDGGRWIRRNNRPDSPRLSWARVWEAAAGWLALPLNYAGQPIARLYRREPHHDRTNRSR